MFQNIDYQNIYFATRRQAIPDRRAMVEPGGVK